MKKKIKFKLDELKVNSFVTSIEDRETQGIKGGKTGNECIFPTVRRPCGPTQDNNCISELCGITNYCVSDICQITRNGPTCPVPVTTTPPAC